MLIFELGALTGAALALGLARHRTGLPRFEFLLSKEDLEWEALLLDIIDGNCFEDWEEDPYCTPPRWTHKVSGLRISRRPTTWSETVYVASSSGEHTGEITKRVKAHARAKARELDEEASRRKQKAARELLAKRVIAAGGDKKLLPQRDLERKLERGGRGGMEGHIWRVIPDEDT